MYDFRFIIHIKNIGNCFAGSAWNPAGIPFADTFCAGAIQGVGRAG